ncbi:MAG: metallophosphoesterase family protein [Chitinophagaceae bacterium]
MKSIGLLSDTHDWLDEAVFSHFANCDEIWHAGDFGTVGIANRLAEGSGLLVRGVYGNIDAIDIQSRFPEELRFECEGIKVLMKHIGGYPGRYAPGVKNAITSYKPQLFISGHSHILKVMYDEKLSCLHMNPGAAGKQGWHKVRTIIRFKIAEGKMSNCEVIELGTR